MFNFKGPETSSNNYWVKCPSRKFGGMFYYYNNRTKLSVWNLNDLTVTKDVNFQQIPNVPCINREPLNPPNFFGNVPQSFGNQSINNPFKANTNTNIKPLLYPNRIVSKPNLWDSSSNLLKINSKQFITIGTQTDIDEKDSNFQCATPLRKPILREPKIFGKIKKDVSRDSPDSNDIFEHGFKAIINLTNCSSHSSGNTKKSRTSSISTNVENIASDDIIDINIQDLNIKDSNSTGTCTKDESCSSSNSLAVTDLRHIITGRRKSKTYHDLDIFANDKESVLDSFITGPFKDKIRNLNESKESTHENVVQNKSIAGNVAHLKDLAAPDQMTSPWYLVVDTNMLLQELDFLTNLLKSNPDCKLSVPDVVQKELRNLSVNKLTENSLIIAARRAIRYLTNNLSEDCMIKISSQVSERKEIAQSDVIDNVINCCMQIKNNDHFLIVLSNNEILHKKLNLLGIDCYSNDKLKEIMENKPKAATLQKNINKTRKRAFEPTTESTINSKKMYTQSLPKNTTGTFINNQNNFYKDFLAGNDQSISTLTYIKDKPINNNPMKIVGGARKKVIENQNKKETTPTFDLTFKSLSEKYNSESLQQNPSMFKIANKAIENKLKLRMDEWLCRFVQVMEETLIQVLQGFSAVFTCPPSLQEAVAIVHKLHKNNETVNKYCNNFSSLLSALNDPNGKFKKDLSPNKFMEIFASGYQLVELLLDLEKNDVGLDSGIKYLKELLDEINDPEVDVDVHGFDSDIDPTNYAEEIPDTKNKPASSGNKVSTSIENIVVQVSNEGKEKTTSVDKYFQNVSLTPIPKQAINNNFENNCISIKSATKNDNFEEKIDKNVPLQHATFISKDSEKPVAEEGDAALDGNVLVAFVFQKFFDEIETTFVSIETFIKETKKCINKMDDNKKKQSGHNLSQIYVTLLNIMKSLKQIMYRDRFEDENIRHLIAKVIPTQEINDDIIMDYSEKVENYLDQAALLENSLNELLTCLKTGAIKIVKTTQ